MNDVRKFIDDLIAESRKGDPANTKGNVQPSVPKREIAENQYDNDTFQKLSDSGRLKKAQEIISTNRKLNIDDYITSNEILNATGFLLNRGTIDFIHKTRIPPQNHKKKKVQSDEESFIIKK